MTCHNVQQDGRGQRGQRVSAKVKSWNSAVFLTIIMLALFLLIWTILSEISLEFSQLKKGLGFCFAF